MWNKYRKQVQRTIGTTTDNVVVATLGPGFAQLFEFSRKQVAPWALEIIKANFLWTCVSSLTELITNFSQGRGIYWSLLHWSSGLQDDHSTRHGLFLLIGCFLVIYSAGCYHWWCDNVMISETWPPPTCLADICCWRKTHSYSDRQRQPISTHGEGCSIPSATGGAGIPCRHCLLPSTSSEYVRRCVSQLSHPCHAWWRGGSPTRPPAPLAGGCEQLPGLRHSIFKAKCNLFT